MEYLEKDQGMFEDDNARIADKDKPTASKFFPRKEDYSMKMMRVWRDSDDDDRAVLARAFEKKRRLPTNGAQGCQIAWC